MGILLALLKLAARPERLLEWEPEAADVLCMHKCNRVCGLNSSFLQLPAQRLSRVYLRCAAGHPDRTTGI